MSAVEPYADATAVVEGVVKRFPPPPEPHPVLLKLARLGGVEVDTTGVSDDLDDDDDDDDGDLDEEGEAEEQAGGEVIALRGVSLVVERGEIVVLVGPPGSGKSVLLKLLAGLTTPTAGRIVVRGRVAPALRSLERLPPSRLGVRKILLAIAMMSRVPRSQVKRRFPEIFELAGLSDADVTLATKLTPRQLDRVLLAMMLSVEADLILVDVPLEPGRVRDRLVERIGERRREGASVVLAAGLGDPITEIADRVVFLDDGVVLDHDHGREADEEQQPGPERDVEPLPSLPLSPEAEHYLEFLRALVGERRAAKAYRLAALRAAPGAERVEWTGLAETAGFDWTQHVGIVGRLRQMHGLPLDAPLAPGASASARELPLSGDAQRYADHLRIRIGDDAAEQALTNLRVYAPEGARRLEWTWLARWAGFDFTTELPIVERLRRLYGADDVEPIFGAVEARRTRAARGGRETR